MKCYGCGLEITPQDARITGRIMDWHVACWQERQGRIDKEISEFQLQIGNYIAPEVSQ